MWEGKMVVNKKGGSHETRCSPSSFGSLHKGKGNNSLIGRGKGPIEKRDITGQR